jgi:hypothetical protein
MLLGPVFIGRHDERISSSNKIYTVSKSEVPWAGYSVRSFSLPLNFTKNRNDTFKYDTISSFHIISKFSFAILLTFDAVQHVELALDNVR